MINLRYYQDRCVQGLRACFRNLVLSVLLVLPTGGGKTVVFTYIAQRMALKDKKVLILVHRIELLRQTSKALGEFGVEHGMINPNYTPNFSCNVQVASVQTIINRLNYFAAVNWIPDTIIIDEAHHATAGSWRKIKEFFQSLNEKLTTIGVTATPTRADGQGLGVSVGGMFAEIVIGPYPSELMAEGFLVTAKIFSPPVLFDKSVLKKSGKDYNPKDIENLVDKPKITGSAVEHYRETCPGVPTIVFCATVKHAQDVAEEFRAAGFRFYAVDGAMDDDERTSIISGLSDGRVQGVCSCDLISEGTDIPKASCAILLRITQSLSLHIQQIGRVLRPVFPDGFDASKATTAERLTAIANSEKPHAFILDHVGNVGAWANGEYIINHGRPQDNHDWSLEGEVKNKRGKKKTETAVRVQMCMSCFAIHEPAPVCPQCGHVYEIKDKTPKQVDGQLQEVTAEAIAKKKEKQAVGMSKSLEDLIRIGELRGYKPNWAVNVNAARMKKLEKIQAAKDEAEAIAKAQEIPFEVVGEFDEDLEF